MSKYLVAELRRRRLSNEPIEKTRMRFLDCVINGKLDWEDLTQQEETFLFETMEAFGWLLVTDDPKVAAEYDGWFSRRRPRH
jgi:hypothetical protein